MSNNMFEIISYMMKIKSSLPIFNKACFIAIGNVYFK